MSEGSATATMDREFLLKEYARLSGDLMRYYDSITATERLALAGAAGIVAFLYSDLPSFAVGQGRILSALPAAIIALAGLRCLSIFMVMNEVARYLETVEAHLVSPGFGFQRRFGRGSRLEYNTIVATTTAFWVLALIVALAFWALYEPAPIAAPLAAGGHA